jgi:lipopolysaccharide export LptBFGC system permease protein LptF
MFIALGNEGTVMKGSTEMSLAELRRDVAAARARWDLQRAREGEWAYHIRWGLPWATLVLALFAFASGRRLKVWHKWTAMAACVIYFVLLHLGEALVYRWSVPGFLGPWLPNVAFMLAAIVLRLHPPATGKTLAAEVRLSS